MTKGNASFLLSCPIRRVRFATPFCRLSAYAQVSQRQPAVKFLGESEGLGFHNNCLIVACGDGNVYRSDLTVKKH